MTRDGVAAKLRAEFPQAGVNASHFRSTRPYRVWTSWADGVDITVGARDWDTVYRMARAALKEATR